MSIIFRWQRRKVNACPNCGALIGKKVYDEIECSTCVISFGRIIEIEDAPSETTMDARKPSVKQHLLALKQLGLAEGLQDRTAQMATRPPKTAYDEVDDMQHYRRIKLVHRQRKRIWETLPAQDGKAMLMSRIGEDVSSVTDIAEIEDIANSIQSVNESADSADASDTVHEENSSSQQEDDGIQSVDPNVVDHDMFEQILEMDDDDEREFSRELILGDLEKNKWVVKDIEKQM